MIHKIGTPQEKWTGLSLIVLILLILSLVDRDRLYSVHRLVIR